MEAAILTVLPELAPQDRLVVIADNCTDKTGDLARKRGAIVIERAEPDRRGKGYALSYGLQFLAKDPPQAVVMLDADCTVSTGTVEKLARCARDSGRPVQARYSFELPSKPDPLAAVSAFAFLVKSLRPRGLHRLGLPCALMGSGMAIPWSLIDKVVLDEGNLVEDLQWGLDLALAGHPPMLCPGAEVTPRHPQQSKGAMSQRRRWEHGHLATLIGRGPRLVARAVRSGRLDLMALALDLCVPPLSLLILMTTIAMGGALLTVELGASWIPLGVLAFSAALVILTVAAAWWRFGRTSIPAIALLFAPVYVLWKVCLYRDFLVRRQKVWVRTERELDR